MCYIWKKVLGIWHTPARESSLMKSNFRRYSYLANISSISSQHLANISLIHKIYRKKFIQQQTYIRQRDRLLLTRYDNEVVLNEHCIDVTMKTTKIRQETEGHIDNGINATPGGYGTPHRESTAFRSKFRRYSYIAGFFIYLAAFSHISAFYILPLFSSSRFFHTFLFHI